MKISRSIAKTAPRGLLRYVPSVSWLRHYRSQDLPGDAMAGVIVAIMLIPQGMAYAMLAGLPPQVGLYASIVPLVLYALLGSSRSLAVGPVAMVSLLVATGVSQFAGVGTPEYLALALTLALLVGIIQLLMGVARLGLVVNFLSHSVISGFTSAAALVIALNQLKHLLGISVPRTEHVHELLLHVGAHITQANLVTLGIGLLSIGILFFFKGLLGKLLQRWGTPPGLLTPMTKSAPLVVLIVGTLLVWRLGLHRTASVAIVGAIPSGLPPLTLPRLDWGTWQQLLPTALVISFVGFMESIAVAKSLASKRRQKVDANQELVALGAANLGSAFTGGYPVTGGFSRSVVNFAAGANTGLASLITASLIGVSVLFLTPLFHFLPKVTLASIIVVAVLGLVDVKTFRHVWRYSKADAASLLITFTSVLTIGIEMGILVGAATALALHLWRTSKPHTAHVGRVDDSEHFRNVLRHDVKTCPHVMAIRIDESLYFANTQYLESHLLTAMADHPDVDHLVLVGSGINFIDASALETLEQLMDELSDAGVTLHFAEFKGPVLDRLQRSGFLQRLGMDRLFLSTHQAMIALGCE